MIQYLGPKEVLAVVKLDNKTPLGNELVEVCYKDGTKEILSKLILEASITNKPTDLTTLRNLRIFPVVKELLNVLLKWNVKINEVEFIVEIVKASINDNMDKASSILWKKNIYERTTLDVDTILRENKGGMNQPIQLDEPSGSPQG